MDHVRKQVLSTNTTRQEAAVSLEALEKQVCSQGDCMALATRIKQLFGQLYPEGPTEEAEPFPHRTAVIAVHKTLLALTRAKSQALIVKAWQAWTSYDSSEMFYKYVDESRHRGPETVQVSSDYLEAVENHLSKAHHMYAQLHAPRVGAPVGGAAAGSKPTGSGHTTLESVNTNWQSSAGSSFRGQSAATRGRGRGRGRGGRTGVPNAPFPQPYMPYSSRPGRGKGRGVPAWQPPVSGGWQLPPPPPPAPGASGAHPSPRPASQPGKDKAMAVLAQMAGDFPLGMALVQEKRLPQREAEALVAAGHCMLCLEHGHFAGACPLSRTEAGASFMAEFRRRRKNKS